MPAAVQWAMLPPAQNSASSGCATTAKARWTCSSGDGGIARLLARCLRVLGHAAPVVSAICRKTALSGTGSPATGRLQRRSLFVPNGTGGSSRGCSPVFPASGQP